MTTDKKQEKISGRTYIKDETIVWDSDEGLVSQIPIKDIKIIGEYTTSAGPMYDDWYFVFILHSDNIQQVSAYATGAHEMLGQLGHRLNFELAGQLANSADWKTNVLWPTSLRGQNLYTLTEKKPKGTWEKIKTKFGLNDNKEIELTDNLKKYLS
jgi:hypothetical protein